MSSVTDIAVVEERQLDPVCRLVLSFTVMRTLFCVTVSAFVSFAKHGLPYLLNSLVVYRFKYNCDADYIGLTNQCH